MTKNKNTKRALLASVLSLMLCMAMLIGSTFAWFTNTVVSGKNKIVAGNLDVELEYSVDGDNWNPVEADTNLFKPADETLWEPGHTEYVYLRVRNAGSLALRYELALNVYGDENGAPEKTYTSVLKEEDGVTNKTFKLSEYLVFNRTEGQKTVTKRDDLWIKDAEAEKAAMGKLDGLGKTNELLTPGAEEILTLAVYMPTQVGNDANQLTIAKTEGEDPETAPTIYLGLSLFATQTPYENDSFNSNYDVAANPNYDPVKEADEQMLAADPKYSFRDADGKYWQYPSASAERDLLFYLATHSVNATLIRDIGAPADGLSSQTANYNGQHSVLDLNGKKYLAGGLEFKPTTTANDSSLTIKNGTMESSINSQDILKSYNAMQTVMLEGVNLKWSDPLAWNAKDPNYYGLNLAANVAGTTFTVKDSVLDCNAKFHTTTNFSNPDDRPVVNITGTTVNGRLSGSSVAMTVNGCTVNGEVYCNGSWSSTTTVNINDSTINGNAFFDASASQQNNVTITDTTITGNLQTSSTRNNVHITLTNVTVKGTLSYNNSSWTVPASKVTIVSGNYGFDPTNYLASGSTAAYNDATGLWVVTAG